MQTDELLITEADTHHVPSPLDPAKEIENKVAPRVAEARLIRVMDQTTLNLVGDRLAINKALQKEAGEIFDPVIGKAHEAHKAAIAAKKRVTDPLTQEETLLKSAAQTYVVEQRRIAEEAERQARLVREAEERRLLAEAEERRRQQEAEINAQLQREHEAEVERAAQAAEAEGAAPQEVFEILNTPAPAPVTVPLDVPEMPAAVAPAVPAMEMPKGLSMAKKFKAELTSITLLCKAVAEGKAPSSYVTANMTALNSRARADGAGMNVPGVRVVEDFSMSQRSR